jgi:hypothetical protein
MPSSKGRRSAGKYGHVLASTLKHIFCKCSRLLVFHCSLTYAVVFIVFNVTSKI